MQRQLLLTQPAVLQNYQMLGEQILQAGEPLIAHDLIEQGLAYWPQDVRLRQLKALTLARSGASEAANALALQLYQEGHQDEETQGLLARTYKDLALRAGDPGTRQHWLKLAFESYAHAYKTTGGYWTGINAATLAVTLGNLEGARILAMQVHNQCMQALHDPPVAGEENYWVLATLGEAALILGDRPQAEDCYSRAVQVGQGRLGVLSSTRRNARLLLQALEIDPHTIDRCFQIPKVIVFSGHMIDPPDRPHPRFPPALEPTITRMIRERLQALDGRLGYASAACGADILFLEALLELGGEAHIVLPYDRDTFIKDSVMIADNADWVPRFEAVLQQATELITASQQRMTHGSLYYVYTNQVICGLGRMRAAQLETDLMPLVVWDCQPEDDPGGTASMVQYWQSQGQAVEVIDLRSVQPWLGGTEGGPVRLMPRLAVEASQLPLPLSRQIMGMLFADVVHFSKLAEEQVALFVQEVLTAYAQLLAGYPSLAMKNTWGDALCCVFSSVRETGCCALAIQRLMHSTDWVAKGLPADLNVRIAVHAGPAYRCLDPVTGQVNYIGSHVNHTARIEPITPPGEVYASQGFAALAAAEGVRDFCCEYVGRMPWAKGYGTFPTYHVHYCATDRPAIA